MQEKITQMLSLFLLLILGCGNYTYSFEKRIDINNKSQILKMIKETKTDRESSEIFYKLMHFGMPALPFIIEGMKSDNPYNRYHSVNAFAFVFQRKVTEPLPSGFTRFGEKSFKEFDFLTEEEKNLFEEGFNLLLKLVDDPYVEVRKAVGCYLGLFGDKRAVPVLEKLLKDPDPWIRFETYQSLWLMGYKEYDFIKIMTGKDSKKLEHLLDILSHDITPFGTYRMVARKIIREFGEKAIPVLINLAKTNQEPGRTRTIEILGEMKAEEAIPIFEEYLKEETRDETILSVQLSCISSLIKIDTEKSTNVLFEYGLKNKSPDIRYYTAERLLEANRIEYRYPTVDRIVKENKEEIKKILKELAEKGDSDIKLKVALLLIRVKEKEGIPILIELLKDRKYFGMAKDWLESTTKQRFGDIPPVVSKKKLEQYIEKWKSWWENNKDTFKFQEEQN